MSHRGSLLCLPTGMHAWAVTTPRRAHARKPRAGARRRRRDRRAADRPRRRHRRASIRPIRARVPRAQGHRRGRRHRRRRAHLQRPPRRAARGRRRAHRRRTRAAEAARASRAPPTSSRRTTATATSRRLVLKPEHRDAVAGALRLQRRRRRDPRPRLASRPPAKSACNGGPMRSQGTATAKSARTRSPTRCSTPSRSTACRPAPLLRLIAARRFDLYDDPMPDLATFEGYAGETVSVLYQLAAMILNGGEPGRDRRRRRPPRRRPRADRPPPRLRLQRLPRPALPAVVDLRRQRRPRAGDLRGPGQRRAARGASRSSPTSRATTSPRPTRAIAALPRHLRPAFAMIALLPSQLRALERGAESPYSPPTRASRLAEDRSALVVVGDRRT